MARPLYDLLPSGEFSSDELLGRFLDYARSRAASASIYLPGPSLSEVRGVQ